MWEKDGGPLAKTGREIFRAVEIMGISWVKN